MRERWGNKEQESESVLKVEREVEKMETEDGNGQKGKIVNY